MTNNTPQECKNCGLMKSTCEMENGNEWVKNCQKIEGKKHDFEEVPQKQGWEEKLREEFYEKFPPPMLIGLNQEQLFNWWLSKLQSKQEEWKIDMINKVMDLKAYSTREFAETKIGLYLKVQDIITLLTK